MAGTIYISEEAAVRDLPGLIDRALAGEAVVLRRRGRDVVVLSPVATTTLPTRTLGEILESLRQRKATQGLATVDEDFASDMKKIHDDLNAPLDTSAWE
jgi:antitoxin (DNA-binding transcriptional repressor) of toxin-antitoxin stability system